MKILAQCLSGFVATAVLAACDINLASADNQCRKNTFKSAKEASEFWTPDMRDKAEPMEMPVLPEKFRKGLEGEGRRYPSAISGGNPYPADVEKAPFKAGGRLLFLDSDGDPTQCTAEFAGSQNIIMTAAHCVQDPDNGKWNRNFFFERAYKNHNAQIYQISEMTVRSEWRGGGEADPRFDYAFLVAEQNYNSPLILHFGAVRENITSFGYPDNYGGGEVMYAVNGYRAAEGNGLVLMRDNPMKHGSSGGAWINTGEAGKAGIIVYGLNSHDDDKIANAVWSPLFGKTTESLFKYAKTLPCSGR